ncbi:hypothetical protein MTBLM1_20196 [Rhodospirillaceae bacterium LM-1]|nr:hypothetical protein MTBLM1_20196 [Rhodospirillaceae bacterium LM-1]
MIRFFRQKITSWYFLQHKLVAYGNNFNLHRGLHDLLRCWNKDRRITTKKPRISPGPQNSNWQHLPHRLL